MTAATGRGGLLADLLPDEVMVSELFTDATDVALFPQEAELVAGAMEARRREFTTVRGCARTALARLGVAPGPILPAGEGPMWAQRAPRWPEGVVGSMTHCDGYRAAVVARRMAIASVGVDAEPNAPMPERVVGKVVLPEERGILDRLARAAPAIAWDRLLFSAKESVFKAWYPLTGRWLGFNECVIEPDLEGGTFTGTLKVPGPVVSGQHVGRFEGRWHSLAGEGPGLLATAVVVRMRSRQPGESW